MQTLESLTEMREYFHSRSFYAHYINGLCAVQTLLYCIYHSIYAYMVDWWTTFGYCIYNYFLCDRIQKEQIQMSVHSLFY